MPTPKKKKDRPRGGIAAAELMTVEGLMDYLCIGRTTVFRLLKDGFPHARIGKRILFRKTDVDGYIEKHTVGKP
jgi:excisionase family DNA binding protein